MYTVSSDIELQMTANPCCSSDFSAVVKNFPQFCFEFFLQGNRFQNFGIPFLGEKKRKQDFFGDSRDFDRAVIMNNLPAVQRGCLQSVKCVFVRVQFHVSDLFKVEKVIRIDRSDDLSVGFECSFQKFRTSDPLQGKCAGLFFLMAKRFAVPGVVEKDQSVRFDDAF